MRVLYLGATSDAQPTPEALLRRGYEVVPVQALHDELEFIRREHFDAIVIPEEIEDPEIIVEFAAHAHRAQPKLPVFLLNDWVFDLLETLDSLGTPEQTRQTVN